MKRRPGFSLLEVLLALALVVLLSGGIFGFLWNLVDRRDALIRATGDAQSAGALFELLEADIACAIAGDPVLGAGIVGDDRQLTVLSRRVWAPTSPPERSAAAGDLQRSEYTFSLASGTVRLKRSPVSSSSRGIAVDDVVCERIAAFRLRYFDGRAWTSTFNTVEKRDLPLAVEVAVWFGTPGSVPAAAGEADEVEPSVPLRSPDRLRIICIADGPTTWWKEMQ
jgi:prepilin-type N-terminal cleavage/methylation domain-containing protein